MRIGINGFQPARLVQARESIGLTRVALSELVKVSPATITNWEKGDQLPGEPNLRALAEVFHFSRNWFLKPLPEANEVGYFYRSLSQATKAARLIAKTRLDWVAEISLLLCQWVNLPPVNITPLSRNEFLSLTDEDIERIADDLRTNWGLGRGPISDVMLALENNGIIVARDELGYSKMDGVSCWSKVDGRPYVFISSDKANGIRNRFDVAHELAHVILHANLTEQDIRKHYKLIESQADQFAGCFLLPSETFGSEVSWPTLDNLLSMKPRWKTSVAAMVMRTHQLGLINDEQKMRLFKGRSARGWVKGEPYDDMVKLEKPRLLNRSVRLVVDNNIVSKDELVNELGLSNKLLESLIGLEPGYFGCLDSDNLVQLSVARSHKSAIKKSGAKVLTFPG